jgi:hypothetical protein
MKNIKTFEEFVNESTDRSGLMGNFAAEQNPMQSMARFQIGEMVQCCNPEMECCGMIGKIIAFEDNTIRWEVSETETGIGQTSKQYRCHAEDLTSPMVPVVVEKEIEDTEE